MIIPAPLPENYAHLERELRHVKDAVSRVQIDVVDGVFAPSTTWPYNNTDASQWRALVAQESGLPFWEVLDFEIDMMVDRPEEKIDDWINAGAETLIIHIESTDKLKELIERASERGVEVALALKPSTNIELLAPWIERIAFVQCMGNDKIGYHGVSLDERIFDKIRTIRERWPALAVGIDIGVNEQTIGELAKAGATRFAAGSAILSAEDAEHAVQVLSRAME